MPRRRLQFCGEIENARTKRVKPGVVPRACCFPGVCFFPKIEKLHSLIQKNCAPFAHVLAARHADERLNVLRQIDNAFVVFGCDQNVAVSQNKRRIANEIPRQIDNPAGAVLRGLRRKLDVDLVA